MVTREPNSADRESPRPAPRREPSPLLVMGAAAELGLVVGGLAILGWWLDGKFGTLPWLTLSGAAIGIVGGLYNLWRVSRRFF